MRKCHDCGTLYDNDHVTICLECGSGTREVEEKPEVKDGDRDGHRQRTTKPK